jgi:hypothetical protein
VREAGRRYGRTLRGRRKSAERSQRYRDRQIVTHQGSLSIGACGVLDASEARTSPNVASAVEPPVNDAPDSFVNRSEGVRCSFCRRWCDPYVRHAPLRRRSSTTRYLRMEQLR